MSGAPIFIYHDLVDGADALAAIAPAHRPYVLTRPQFVAHLDALAAADVGAVPRASTVSEVLDAPTRGRFVLSFDDGHESSYAKIFPLLAARRWPATFFIVAGWVGTRDAVTWSQLRAMADAGMEIGSHSLTHASIQGASAAEIRREFGDSKRMLEDGLGRAVTVASLPRGSAERRAAAILAELGYRAFCTSAPGLISPATDPLDAPRIAMKWKTSAAFVTRVLAGHRLTLTRLRSSYALKALGKRVVGLDRWRRVRGAMVAGTARAGL